jgi:type II secretory pathway pseudopilin PulG
MGILAVTLAPRLSQYVEKAKTASDREVVNTVFTAAKLAYLDAPDAFSDLDALDATTTGIELNGGLYSVSTTNEWTIEPAYGDTGTPAVHNAFAESLRATLGDFNLKSSKANENSNIIVSITDGKVSVKLFYDVPTAPATYDSFATGGLNTTTGLAKLDGTKARPELIFNYADSSKLATFWDFIHKHSLGDLTQKITTPKFNSAIIPNAPKIEINTGDLNVYGNMDNDMLNKVQGLLKQQKEDIFKTVLKHIGSGGRTNLINNI